MNQQVTIGPSRTEIRKSIMQAICEEFDLDEETLRGPIRTPDVVDARIKAAFRLRSAGLSTAAIARILNRDSTVVSYYFNDTARQNNRDRQRLKRHIRYLPDDVRSVIEAAAKAEGVATWLLLREWIVERARYEIEAKARAERGAA